MYNLGNVGKGGHQQWICEIPWHTPRPSMVVAFHSNISYSYFQFNYLLCCIQDSVVDTIDRRLTAHLTLDELAIRLITSLVCQQKSQNIEASLLTVYKNSSTAIKCQHSVEIRLRSWAAKDFDLVGIFRANRTLGIFSVNGRYGEEKLSNSVEYDRRNELEHSVGVRIISGEDTPIFTANFNINTGSRKSLAVDVTAGRRVTFDGQLTSKTANVNSNSNFTSTFAQLENVGADFHSLSSLSVHRYSLAVQHLGRQAELFIDFHRTGMTFKSASVNLATPIYDSRGQHRSQPTGRQFPNWNQIGMSLLQHGRLSPCPARTKSPRRPVTQPSQPTSLCWNLSALCFSSTTPNRNRN